DKGVMRLASSVLAVCNESACGLQALASSRYLDGHAETPLTLHEVLKKHGYRVHLVFSGDHRNFYGIDRIYGPIDSYFDGSFQKARYVNDDRLVFDRLRDFAPWDGVPTLFQFHLMSTHALGERFAETPAYGPGTNYTGTRWTSAEEMPRLATNFYDRGVLQMDAVVSTLLSQLEERGYLKDAVVVITGDHGESLGERGHFSHAHSVWEEALRVPFIVLAFGNADPGPLNGGPALSQIDIAPTVLRMLDMPQPATWQGSPVQAPIQRRFIRFQQGDQVGLVDTASRDARYKHWIDTRDGRAYTFNLTTDPAERIDVTSKVPLSLRQQWRDELLRHAGALPAKRQETLRGIHLGE
ncbi:MAG: sulfatase-like hydrolase/transferase, partial [Rhizobacter sp.]